MDTPNKIKIKKIFNKNIRGVETIKKLNYDGEEGHKLEKNFGIEPNNRNQPDINGYEAKSSSAKITLCDMTASCYIFNIYPMTRDQFIKIFGNLNKLKNRYSWSGSCVPKYEKYNKCGQKLIIINNNLIAVYSYSKDQRARKSEFPDFIKAENLVIAYWTKEKIKKIINNKFAQKGFFICEKENGIYNDISFGRSFDYKEFLEGIKSGIIIFDSGMYQGNKRNYSLFRASRKNFWNNLIY